MTTKTPMSGEELTDFLTKVLYGIGAPATPWTLEFMEKWSASEGTLASFNPLATERPVAGATKFNPQGVRNYISEEQGVSATVATLKLSYYKPIVKALREQKVSNLPGILSAYQTWAGVGAPEEYMIARELKGGWTPSGARTKQAETIATASERPDVGRHAAKAAHEATTIGAGALAFVLLGQIDAIPWSTVIDDLRADHWWAALVLLAPFAVRALNALVKNDG